MKQQIADLVTGTVVAFRAEEIRITDRIMEGRQLACHIDHPHMAIGLLDKIEGELVYIEMRACYIPVWP